jgi:redox-sensitive bicupin YhaK (pirin superfamily)
MITVRASEQRGHFNHGWLDTYHTFSFADYHDPEHMHFRALRVINEDVVAPGQGFGTHPHRDMEIITYVLDGALEHRDSLGNGSIIRPGDGQRMSAGSGILHSEFNPSPMEPVHLLQIWILPEKKGIEPSYEQKAFRSQQRQQQPSPGTPAPEDKQGKWKVIAERMPADGAVKIHQDVKLSVASLEAGEQITYSLAKARYAWIQIARGSVTLNGTVLKQGDGAAVSQESELTITAGQAAEVLLFDLA